MFVSGKVITLRDLSNMKARTKSGPGNDLHAVICDLRRDPSLSIEVFSDEEDNLLGIFYQDTAMQSPDTNDQSPNIDTSDQFPDTSDQCPDSDTSNSQCRNSQCPDSDTNG